MNEYTTTRRINDLKEILEDINNYSELGEFIFFSYFSLLFSYFFLTF